MLSTIYMHTNILASSKRSGSSLASFSRATSAIGPNITTGLRKPAAQKHKNQLRMQLQSHTDNPKAGVRHGPIPHPLSVQLFHKPGTLFGPAGRRGLLCSSSGSSLSCEDHETSRSPPCRPLLFWGECIARWTAAPPCLTNGRTTEAVLSVTQANGCVTIFGTANLNTANTKRTRHGKDNHNTFNINRGLTVNCCEKQTSSMSLFAGFQRLR